MDFFSETGLRNFGNSISSQFEQDFMGQYRHQTTATPSSNKPPPASSRAMTNLPNVQVTADDLLEETNKECAICLEEQEIGHTACKLPCGHLFHRTCILSWLEKQCTCPTCRFELETADSAYETQRAERMKSRKQRIRIDELRAKKISELREICRALNIDISSCIDKGDIIEKLQESGKIVITQGLPPIEITEESFRSKSVSELKHLLLSFGLSTEGALEKGELRQRLLTSGRIVLIATIVPSVDSPSIVTEHSQIVGSEPELKLMSEAVVSDTLSVVSTAEIPEEIVREESCICIDDPNTIKPECFENNSHSDVDNGRNEERLGLKNRATEEPVTIHSCYTANDAEGDEQTTVDETLQSLSLRELHQLCREYNVSAVDCLEREEVVARLRPLMLLDSTANTSRRGDQERSSNSNNSSQKRDFYQFSISSERNDHSVSSTSSYSYSHTQFFQSTSESTSASNNSRGITLSRSVLSALPLRELRAITQAYELDVSRCLERSDLMHVLEESPEISLID